MSKRCFLSIDVENPAQRAKLRDIQQKIVRHGDHNPVDPSQFHITLKFFGDIPEDETKKIRSSIRESLRDYSDGSFSIEVNGLGVFPKKSYITVVWAGISKGEEAANRLHKKIMGSLHTKHIDDHDFHPHITVSRVNNLSREEKNNLHETLNRYENEQFFSLEVHDIKLKESVLGDNGPTYRTLKTYTL